MILENLSNHFCCGGRLKRYRYHANCLDADMCFSIFLPAMAEQTALPVLYWIADCHQDDTSIFRCGHLLPLAARNKMVIVSLAGIPADSLLGRSQQPFLYLNATKIPWQQHYQLFDYIYKELPEVIESHFPVQLYRAIAGIGAGGHAALVVGLSQHKRYKAISAINPVISPANNRNTRQLLLASLGEQASSWLQYDACELLALAVNQRPVLVSQAELDPDQDMQGTALLIEQARRIGYPLDYRMHLNYDASDWFTMSVIESHMQFHRLYS
ncbi:alpha/beta hydrolase-fold protein [Shewanella sp. NIFS-20-20]|uniref:alpha/beta hydrolase-fold protein n=1 Tax=Shewanella sp. NIFS-20-20 TaxID=2853806 RepID=UPI001C45EE1F|nr:alpha/beta hydrolase-fold protein [Shewanella sp. NIFS-20-20]MBV7314560.1 S-formylglutathione hydrolase [Shewanella sp. NIFS-20-20]